jgi:hypothetical protein
MGKFYVISGEIKAVISAPHIEDAEQAACEVLLTCINEHISPAPILIVSQRGFDLHEHSPSEDVVFATNLLLKKTGLLCEPDYNDEKGCDDYEY